MQTLGLALLLTDGFIAGGPALFFVTSGGSRGALALALMDPLALLIPAAGMVVRPVLLR